jgi:hypothetical protein
LNYQNDLIKTDVQRFIRDGDDGVKNTQGFKIVPMKARAIKDAEEGLESAVANSINYNDVLDNINLQTNDLYTSASSSGCNAEDKSLIQEIVCHFMDIDLDKVDEYEKEEVY